MSASSLQIKPRLEARANCHVCGQGVDASGVLWQGIHVCAEYLCSRCGAQFVEDMPIGHAISSQFRVDVKRGLLGGHEECKGWFGEPLLNSLRKPNPSILALEVETRRRVSSVVVLNCIDFLYGHCVLKLLNAARHLRESEPGLVVIIPKFLAWMVPEGVAEVWQVDLPLQCAQEYFPDLNRRISKELERFEEAKLSRAFSHPTGYRIEDFTRVPRHDFSQEDFRVTFVWRPDRLWLNEGIWTGLMRRLGLAGILHRMQRRKIRSLLARIRVAFPQARPTVAGFGRQGGFPAWIDDRRLERAETAEAERALCQVYAESRVTIGVHGSNMLLASGHAGMCVDLMPASRWGNIAQDILYHDADFAGDLRLSAYRIRFVPVEIGSGTIGSIVAEMIDSFDWVRGRFTSKL